MNKQISMKQTALIIEKPSWLIIMNFEKKKKQKKKKKNKQKKKN